MEMSYETFSAMFVLKQIYNTEMIPEASTTQGFQIWKRSTCFRVHNWNRKNKKKGNFFWTNPKQDIGQKAFLCNVL